MNKEYFNRLSEDWVLGEFEHYECLCGVGRDDAPDYWMKAIVGYFPTDLYEYDQLPEIRKFITSLIEAYPGVKHKIFFHDVKDLRSKEFFPELLGKAEIFFHDLLQPDISKKLIQHLSAEVKKYWTMERFFLLTIVTFEQKDRGSNYRVNSKFTRFHHVDSCCKK